MQFEGILIGAAAFMMIGTLHPVVIKAEYYWGTKVWPLFMIAGLICITASLFIGLVVLSAMLGTFGFALLWSIHELFQQKERVKKGWFPKNPRR
ncbi:DUF4491 family protein [Aminipila sp.]|uniref:DUF4491 family protein n=1 Tax=Aminipila sp. TaxID=2060095 RepID=UPI00289B493A|nr:DUF4491 family protein [Aminipila sp.]